MIGQFGCFENIRSLTYSSELNYGLTTPCQEQSRYETTLLHHMLASSDVEIFCEYFVK